MAGNKCDNDRRLLTYDNSISDHLIMPKTYLPKHFRII